MTENSFPRLRELMPILLVTYELQNAAKDYSGLFDAIKSNGHEWWHYLEHTWIVRTSDSADQFARKLYPLIERTDSLLVVQITRDHQGWLPKDAWDWLNRMTY